MGKTQQLSRAPTSAPPASTTAAPATRQDRFGNAFLADRLRAQEPTQQADAAARSGGRDRAERPVRREVRETVRESISGAPDPYGAWNDQFTWDSKFEIVVDRAAKTLTVAVRIHTDAEEDVRKRWEQAIEGKWGGRYALHVAGDGPDAAAERYPILCDLQWVDDRRRAHYDVTANRPGADADGRAGLGGTNSMTGWGVDDTVDVTHEFGHMLGAVEDYFTTNGEDHTHGGTRQGYRDAGGGVMNNPAEDPFTEHYELIRRHAAKALRVPESRCTVA